jgi:phosphoribosylformylglycinamidine synthase
LAGGQGSLPLAGTAVYMTSYSRLTNNRKHEEAMAERPWLYQTPMDILIKASNGASDFEINLDNHTVRLTLTEHRPTSKEGEKNRKLGYESNHASRWKLYGKLDQAIKRNHKKVIKLSFLVERIIELEWVDAVSSADTGAFGSGIELNAIQRSNPEMQNVLMPFVV